MNQRMDLMPADVVDQVQKLLNVCVHPRFEVEWNEILEEEKAVGVNVDDQYYELKKRAVTKKKRIFEKQSGL